MVISIRLWSLALKIKGRKKEKKNSRHNKMHYDKMYKTTADHDQTVDIYQYCKNFNFAIRVKVCSLCSA